MTSRQHPRKSPAEVAKPGRRLLTAAFAVLGALNDTGQVQQLDLGALKLRR